MKDDETTSPSQVSLPDADTAVAEADAIAHLIEQAKRLRHDVSPVLGFDV